MSGENAAAGLPGYRKTLEHPYLEELYTGAPVAPPTAGLPWTVGGYEYNPLIEDRPSPPPPAPDRGIKTLHSCGSCGSTFGFNGVTDAAVCPRCGEAAAMVTGLTAPGTPWF
ncbi:hypothetical protein [Mycobacterium sp.]|uniref:hypothetical protein n=1 Tax=Mycobacterium sp. TaxID=1785 RepID=UPI003F955860